MYIIFYKINKNLSVCIKLGMYLIRLKIVEKFYPAYFAIMKTLKTH